MSFVNWTAKLAGEEVGTFLQPQPEDEGYYRKPIVKPVLGANGKPNGQKRVIDWLPVAYFLDGDELRCLVAGRPASATDEELWSYVCRKPISYQTYVAVAENGQPWPDLPKPHPMDEGLRRTQAIMQGTDNAPIDKSREDYLGEIEAAIASAPTKVASKEEAEEALGIKNRIGELRLEASKIGKSIYEPLYVAYTKEQKPWTAMVKLAEDAEKRVKLLVDKWNEAERQRLITEKFAAERRQREEEERNARAADRAIARGEAPEAPEVEDIVVPATTTPEPVKPVYGRAVKQELKVFITITDQAAVAAQFAGDPELVALLQKLAERAIKQGIFVPGITVDRRFA